MPNDRPKKRGPKGGVKHQPGRGHDRKSLRHKKKKFAKNAAAERQRRELEARAAWQEWDDLCEEVQALLGDAGKPKVPRPKP